MIPLRNRHCAAKRPRMDSPLIRFSWSPGPFVRRQRVAGIQAIMDPTPPGKIARYRSGLWRLTR